MQNPTFRAYLESKIMTATPEQLQLMLYEGAIRFSQVAKMALLDKDYEKASSAFDRVDGILCELHGGLRPESDPELCDRFASLYNFCSRRMMEANYSHSPDPIDDAILIFQHLRETWVLVLDRLSEERSRNAERLVEVGVA